MARFRQIRRRHQAGVSLVEYAFVLILFLSLLFGISGFGHMLFTYHHVNSAVKEATRYASVRGSSCADDLSCTSSNSASGTAGPTTLADVRTYVQSITPPSIDSSKLTITACGVSGQSACTESGPQVCSSNITDGSGNIIQVATANYPGCTVKVTASYPYNIIFPLLPAVSTTSAPCTSAGFCLSSTSELTIVH
jgi:Flp pilus assembly protein TadG